ncbi:sugar ABC transporter substrate-binding protein [Treponema parvum]|uniref:Sugar ABC transporter substrate-binding protein n=1 Tax=Treponema parvum TaxID=138851 RepID=A0A975EY47_9SPIR|nr:sugar ABC transporter substrate-binding protein [Treponema parvum]QTQ10988.1 sugar ABC transporter substrate-binding protein [Treponema parvum]QTQ17064.1 sugar ABC transporter substrate-binding protein [Treponema parvum]
MKKTLAVLLALLAATGSIFASGDKDAGSQGSGVTTIKYAFWGNPDSIGVERTIIDEFEKKNPNIKVEPVVSAYNDYHTKLMTMISGGMAPDVMRIDSYFFQDFCNLGAVASLKPFIEKSGFDTSIYSKAAIEEATIKGEIHALPWGTAPIYLALNLDTFKKAGIALPSYDWTVDDFIRIVKQFGGVKTGVYGYANQMASNNPFYGFIWAYGANLLTEDRKGYALDSPEGCQALQMIADLYQQGFLPKDMISTPAAETISRWFTSGTLAMMIVSAQEILAIQKVEGINFEVYPFPGGKTVKNTTTVKSNEIAISAASKQKDAAWKFLSFLRGNEGERLYSAARRIPPSLNNDPELWGLYLDATKSPRDIKKATDAINAKYGHTLQLRSGYSEIDANTVPVFQRILSGNVSAEKGLKDFRAKVEEILARNNK